MQLLLDGVADYLPNPSEVTNKALDLDNNETEVLEAREGGVGGPPPITRPHSLRWVIGHAVGQRRLAVRRPRVQAGGGPLRPADLHPCLPGAWSLDTTSMSAGRVQ